MSTTPTHPPAPPRHYCPECGAEHDPAARFCERCGHRFTDAAVAAPAQGESRRGLVVALAVLAALLAAGAVALVLVLGDDDGADEDDAAIAYREEAAVLISPLADANTELTEELLGLGRGDDPADALAAARAADRVAEATATSVARIASPGDAADVRARVTRAIERNRAFLTAVATAISSPSDATASDVGDEAQRARDAWQATGLDGGRIAGVDRLAAWARAEEDAAEDAAAAEREAEEQAQRDAEETVEPEGVTAVECGGFEAVFDVTAVGIDCTTALRAAVWQVSGQGSSEGYSCSEVDRQADGLTSYTCSRGDGTQVNFSAYVG